jgi:hypothetical protein
MKKISIFVFLMVLTFFISDVNAENIYGISWPGSNIQAYDVTTGTIAKDYSSESGGFTMSDMSGVTFGSDSYLYGVAGNGHIRAHDVVTGALVDLISS